MRRNRSPPQANGFDGPPEMATSIPPNGAGFLPRSNTLNSRNTPLNSNNPYAKPDPSHRMHRSASLGNAAPLPPIGAVGAHRRNPPPIPEVPSGPPMPAATDAVMPHMPRNYSIPRAGAMWSTEAERAREALTVRNPGPPTPSAMSDAGSMLSMGKEGKEGGGTFEQLGNMVRKMSIKDGVSHHKVGDAAKNF
jgi:hypothetical protein